MQVIRENRRDLVAGLCVAGLLLPEAVAYAGLARLPVEHALTAMLVGLALYAVFGGSRYAIVSPTSSTATLSAAAVVSMSGVATLADPARYAQALMALVLLSGLALMLLAAVRQGQLSAYVSRPVLRGFAFALAVTIVVRQLPDALGFRVPADAASDPLHGLLYAVTHADQWHVPSMLVAAVAAGLLVALRRWPQWPASMLVIVMAIVASRVLGLNALGVAEVGGFESPSFTLAWPALPLTEWLKLAELAFGLVVLVFAESWGTVRSLALAHGDTVEANRELMVLGACNVGSALFQGMPVGAGFSASHANAAAGACSKWAGGIALAVIAAVLFFASPQLQWLPRPVLAVAVIAALWHALNPRPLLAVWRMQRDQWLLLGAVLAVLLLGVLHGMLVAVGLSLLGALRRFSLPVVHELGELGTSRNYVVLDAHPDASRIQGVLILRPEEPLFFANAERVVADVLARLSAHRNEVRAVILSLEESTDLDSTAAECLIELAQHLRDAGVVLVLSRAKDAVRELLTRCDPDGVGHAGRMHFSVADSVQWLKADQA
ncbi:MAG: sodium-independent anion transporter [Burkholderiales bacterium PBB1]|nr:MAG: sodium-independent anion transporter [Burkholderiales bacterium PBB1]